MNGIIKTLCRKVHRDNTKAAEFGVIFYHITHGARNERIMPGYMLEDGVELADWLTVSVDGKKLYLAIDDYLDMIRGERKCCRAYTAKEETPEHFTLGNVVAWGKPDENKVQLMELFTLHTGKTPLELPDGAAPCVTEAGNLAGWYDRNERRNE